MLRWLTLVAALTALPAWGQLPGPTDPAWLTDLRWLARPGGNDRAFAVGEDAGVEIAGPGVLDYLVYGYQGEMALLVDGEQVFRGNPREEWKPLYIAPRPEEWGELPWAWPLVHVGGPYACCSLPIPFAQSVRIDVSRHPEQLWMSYRRLQSPPEMRVGGAEYLRALSAAHEYLAGPVSDLPPQAGAREIEVAAYCPAGGRATLAELDGPAEVLGMQLRMRPGALNLLRHQVIAITTDGATSLRMPLVDLVGVSHPWPHAWQPRAGDHAAGIVHPYYRSGGRVQPAVVAYFKLPIPFAESLRIELWNRSPRLAAYFQGELLVAPLADAERVGRLCGVSARVSLAAGAESELVALPGAGRLVGLSMFATGHGRDWEWRRRSAVRVIGPHGPIAEGFGLLPMGMQGAAGSNVIAALAWNHNGLQPTGRCGAGRHLWTDPIDLPAGSRVTWQAAGGDAPSAAEVGVLWYQWPDALAYVAPDVPGDVVELPTVWHGQPQRPLPGGWWDEAEGLAEAAEASAGRARAETTGALDVFASGDAYLAWNADRPGDHLDLPAPMPASRYVRLWVHRLLFMAGGTFAISLEPPDAGGAGFEYAKSDSAYLDRVLGRATAEASVECYDVWPHRQAYRFDMTPMLNPAPGATGRIRFTCITKPRGSRGYLLAIDQLGIDPAPPGEDGWTQFEGAAVASSTSGVSAALMRYGREDFQGWGGREVVAEQTGAVTIAVVGAAGPPAGAVELRGGAVEGEWSASAGGEDVPLTSTEQAKEPTVWRVPVEAGAELTVRCTSGPGKLLLDAWRCAEE